MGQDYYFSCENRLQSNGSVELEQALNKYSRFRGLAKFYFPSLDYPESWDINPWSHIETGSSSMCAIDQPASIDFQFADITLRFYSHVILGYVASRATRFALESCDTRRLLDLGMAIGEFGGSSQVCYFPDDSWSPVEDDTWIGLLKQGATLSDLVSYFQRNWGDPSLSPADMLKTTKLDDGTEAVIVTGYFIQHIGVGSSGLASFL